MTLREYDGMFIGLLMMVFFVCCVSEPGNGEAVIKTTIEGKYGMRFHAGDLLELLHGTYSITDDCVGKHTALPRQISTKTVRECNAKLLSGTCVVGDGNSWRFPGEVEGAATSTAEVLKCPLQEISGTPVEGAVPFALIQAGESCPFGKGRTFDFNGSMIYVAEPAGSVEIGLWTAAVFNGTCAVGARYEKHYACPAVIGAKCTPSCYAYITECVNGSFDCSSMGDKNAVCRCMALLDHDFSCLDVVDYDADDAYYVAAAGNLSDCKKFKQLWRQDECTTKFIGSNASYEECMLLAVDDSRYECVTLLALSALDVGICGKMGDEYAKNGCYLAVARASRDMRLCGLIKGVRNAVSTAEECVDATIAYARNVSVCRDLSDPYSTLGDYCYEKFAEKRNLSLCMGHDDSVRGRCTYYLALSTANRELCKDIPTEGDMGWYRDQCLLKLRGMNDDCEEIINYDDRNGCYVESAKERKDHSICDRIPFWWNQQCYYELAVLTGNESLCAKLAYKTRNALFGPWTGDECIKEVRE